jgi:D-beta-D-heptose 7-phosphate kinase/D-beta-D-heptose 1-phosphate adenosyltransferase
MKILVVGDKCTDVFVYGFVNRISPEAPVPVLTSQRQTENSGMSGNVYNNLQILNERFFKSKYEVTLKSNSNDIYKTRYVDEKSNQMLLRVDSNDYSREKFDVKEIEKDEYDTIVVADYNKGFLSESSLEIIPELAKYTFIDTKKKFDDWILGYTFIKINEKEYNETSDWKKMGEVEDRCIVTLGSKGSRIGDRQVTLQNPVSVLDLSGAGDTYMAAFVLWYVEHGTKYNAMNFANQQAVRVVSQQGVTTP